MTVSQPDSPMITQFYATRLGSYDEMYATEHKVLPYWEHFIAALDAVGGEELERRRREAQRLLRKNGVTYNVYGDSVSLTRPWRLDPIPLLISGEEWQAIEAGLRQRAELLDLILKDLYGSQALLKKGLLPSDLVLSHPGFLHPCVGALQPQPRHLTVYSANLARGPDGRMWILADRTQAPSGFGYALENRRAMSRVLPEVIRENPVRRLADFFRTFAAGLAGLARHNKENPRIVVLTPGPFNETYFEHAYVASYLGFTLVQGDDLTVRDGKVWLKTMAGLQPVDVILRRLDDTFCDPLELRSDSRLGVAGLLEAVRRGNVAIANPLGSSVLENPGLLPFLPGLARYYLGEDLILDSAATWWCGQPRERDFVLHNLDRLVIKKIYRNRAHGTLFGCNLSEKEKEALRKAILAKPYLFVGQEQISFSTSPSFINQRIEPRHTVLRNFVIANGDDYRVMPGGLTRIASEKNALFVSNQTGGMSKDTWILSAGTEASALFRPQTPSCPPLSAASEPLTSRAADNLFWVGRYLERGEAAARLLRTVLLKSREIPEYEETAYADCLKILLCALTHVTAAYPGFVNAGEPLLQEPRAELLSLATDGQRPGSLTANIQGFIQAAFSIRDLWSQDTWRSIDTIRRRWQQRVFANDVRIDQLQGYLEELINGIVAFTGLITESMTRDNGWLMLDCGRRLERALNLIALLRATLVKRHDEALLNQVLESVLVSTDSLNNYLRRYRSDLHLPLALDLLLVDTTHPRSLAYQLSELSARIAALPREHGKSRLSEEERLILKAHTELCLCDGFELLKAADEEAAFSALDALLAGTAERLSRTAEVIAQAYFSHSQTSQLMPAKKAPEDEL
jgi:uncharacterized circularly permuted ATP-grasp superfamily protein/uncharacterized alpha-E superfamily protein